MRQIVFYLMRVCMVISLFTRKINFGRYLSILISSFGLSVTLLWDYWIIQEGLLSDRFQDLKVIKIIKDELIELSVSSRD